MKALLMLEDGWWCPCESFSGPGEVFGEIVFNTGMTGYQEVITDPSYCGQIVVMTAPMVGNYGIRAHESESSRIHLSGLVVREYAGGTLSGERKTPPSSSWENLELFPEDLWDREYRGGCDLRTNRRMTELADFLAGQGRVGVEGVDTRELTRRIREQGAMRAGMTTETLDESAFLDRVRGTPGLLGRDLVREVAPDTRYLYHQGPGKRIAVLDCGVKTSTLAELARRDCRVEVFPVYADAGELLASDPEGILLSNGPGDPSALGHVVETVKSLLGRVPVFGICLGHQVIGQALGGKTYKLKFGHHGVNHPVRDERTAEVYITTQNHGFNVDFDTLPRDAIEKTFVNLNDRTLEGVKHREIPVMSVQFHPEAGPGPHDTLFLFDEFLRLVEGS